MKTRPLEFERRTDPQEHEDESMIAQECTLERTTARSDRNRSDARPNTGLIALRDLCFRWCAYLDPVLVIPELSIGIGEHIFIQGPFEDQLLLDAVNSGLGQAQGNESG